MIQNSSKTECPDHLYQVVITGDSIAPEAQEILSPRCHITFTGSYPSSPLLAQKMRERMAHALILRTGKAPAEVIKASPNLKVIAKHGVGVDNIDMQTATQLRIPVMVTASANYQSVAEHTLGLMFSLAKDIPWHDSRIRQGFWDKAQYRGVELYQKTLGLIGFGRIGRRVCELVAPLQMKILVFDPYLSREDLPANITLVQQLEDLLKAADIVSLHCPLMDKTRHLIGEGALGMMKKTAWLINTARGEIVDEEALISALKTGKIAGAGLDTFKKEPPDDLKHLCQAGKVVMTPHVAGATEEAFRRMGIEAAQNVLTILEGKKPDRNYLANPEVLEFI